MHGVSGALSDLLKEVNDPAIQSLASVVEFTKSFETEKTKVLTESRQVIEKQVAEVKEQLAQLEDTVALYESQLPTASPVHKIVLGFKKYLARRNADRQRARVSHADANMDSLVRGNAQDALNRLERIWGVLQQHRFSIYGATGEEKTIAELGKLPDEFVVINDFRKHFHRPIYNRKEDDRIYSIQCDHIVVGPTGLFIIETKNWSKNSISNEDLFSPVKQVQRAAFALFVYLNHAVRRGTIDLDSHWGKRKISPKQIVASMNPVPHSNFQFVKVLNTSNLSTFISAGSRDYVPSEVDSIVHFLQSHRP
jgi:hypothetical protein